MKHNCRHTPHPLSILYRMRRGIPLFLLPLWRLLRTSNTDSRLLTVSLWEIALALLLLLFAVAQYRCHTVSYHRKWLCSQHGVWLRRCRYTPRRAVATVQTTRTPLMMLCGAIRLHIGTAAPFHQPPLLLRSRTFPKRPRRAASHTSLLPRPIPLLVLAFSGSNAAMGLLTLVPLFRWLAELPYAQQIPEQALSALDRFLSEDVPPLLRALAGVFLLGWVAAFLHSIWRYAGFSVQRQANTLRVKTGLITRYAVSIHTEHITSVGLRQTLLTALFGLYTVSVCAAGYGRERDVRPVLLPALHRRTLNTTLHQLLPSLPSDFDTLRPPDRAVYRYALPPLCGCLASLLPLAYRLSLAPLSAVLCPLFLWWLLLRLWAHHRAAIGLSADNSTLLLRYPRRLALCEQRILCRRIDSITITQSPFERRRHLCTVTVIGYGETRRHTVRSLPFEATRRLIKSIKR